MSQPERERLKKARLKKLARLTNILPEGYRTPPKMRMVRPTSPKEAKEFLRDVADHLSNLPRARPRYRFVAYAIKRYLRDSKARDLCNELGLTPPPPHS
jgi:hypothetical protein